ncbi:hypothetical protein G6N74_04620 [Mesorhizobium sp. CGMCC 1.15528]|uniref:Uncharacterized protein n=1 Tax=Mesorhizobium zhangyense TaxID=1776730 RepID=A0A7C9R5F7_9HYPH|nr:hypothetical protein [Mesorhizobium zhangyense]NGN40339.1 hypothetical protein [Mesorhizobium zhangyense]
MEPLHVWTMMQHELTRKSRERQRSYKGEAQEIPSRGILRRLWSGLFRSRRERRDNAC